MEFVTVRQLAAIIESKRREGLGIWGQNSSHYMASLLIEKGRRHGCMEVVYSLWPGPTWNVEKIDYKLMAESGDILQIKSIKQFAQIMCTLNPVRGAISWEEMWGGWKTEMLEVFMPRAQSEQAERRQLTAAKTRQLKRVADIDAQIAAMAGWEVGNAAQQARKDELTRARAVVVADSVVIDARLAELAP